MSLVGDVLALLGGEVNEEAAKLVFGPVRSIAGFGAGGPAAPVKPGTHYLQLFVQEMWLQWSRELLARFYPLAYSVTKIRFGDGDVELPATLGEFKIADGHDFSNLEDALKLNYAMTPVLPYNGGRVEVIAALVGMRSADGLQDAIKAVGQFSSLLMLPQLSSAVAVAAPFAETLNVLIGHSKERFELGIHDAFQSEGENEVAPGYYLAAAVRDGLDLDTVVVNEGRLALASDPTSLVRDFNYLLFRLEARELRDDYEGLSAIFGPVEEAETLVGTTGEVTKEAKALLLKAKLEAWKSDDLTRADRKRLPAQLQARFDDFLVSLGIAAAPGGPDAGLPGGQGFAPAGADVPAAERLAQGPGAAAALEVPDADVLDVVMRA